MKLLTLAVASIVDANTNQGYTNQLIGHSSTNVADQIERGRTIRSKSIAGLFSQLSSAVSAFIAKSRIRAKNRKSAGELSRMSEHMLRDIGLNYNDVKNLSSGLISTDDLTALRRSDQVSAKSFSAIAGNVVEANILKINSANDGSYELAKCS